ncbi:hypothetical protein [Magnetospirillum moscoviense]|uniref:hypothetical protein n=1 Tax=Magnetospirillum moscoviense TaxID=1437059 RepID=UPI000AA26031|nr:hypothetical protein [Magnetospirillum moscoviense]
MFHHLWSRLFGGAGHRKSSSAGAPASDGAGSAKPEKQRRLSPFEQAVQALAARPDGGAGRVRAVSLGDFREAVGDKWPRLADKVAIIVDNLIRRYIGAGNAWQRHGEDSWLLAFTAIDADEARRIVTLIAQEISRHLLGEGCVGGERPLASAACLSAGKTLSADGRVDGRVVQTALAETHAFVEHLDPNAADPGWQRMEAPAHRVVDAQPWTPIVVAKKHLVPSPWQSVGALTGETRLSLLWRPTWVASSEAISAYCARVVRVDGPASPPLEGGQAYPEGDDATAFAIDRFVTANAMRDLKTALAAGRAGTVIVPLCWSSLRLDRRAALLPLFAELQADERQRHLSLEVFRIPDDAEPQAVAEVTRFLQGLCGDVLLRVRVSSDLLCRVDELGGAKVGLDLSELRDEERMNDQRLLQTLESLQCSATQAGAGCYLWSARRRNVVGEVVGSGFDMVNGPGLMKDVGRPAAVVPAPRQRFVNSD